MFVAALLTGVVTGFMLGHALILAPFLDWLLGRPGSELLSCTYPVFRASAGRFGLDIHGVVAALQVLAALVFARPWSPGATWGGAALAGAAGTAWALVHYGSGFGALEAAVARSPGPVPADLHGSSWPGTHRAISCTWPR